jgi:hypothetical protein
MRENFYYNFFDANEQSSDFTRHDHDPAPILERAGLLVDEPI